MTSAVMQAPVPATAGGPRRPGQLALVLQEAFTACVRLRANRQVAADAASFRRQIKRLLAAADVEARAAGYDRESVKLAIYAYTAFLDESVLNSTQPMFAEWPRQPLQEEVFGDHMAGETFFRNLRDLLARDDSSELADVLEVYQLCLLLGFRGRYGAHAEGELSGLTAAAQRKIDRIRGGWTGFAPSWRPPVQEEISLPADPWLRRLLIASGSALILALILYLVYSLALRPPIAELEALRAAIAR